jgi:hypothetical protein
MSIRSKISDFMYCFAPLIAFIAVVGSAVGLIAYCCIGTKANVEYIESSAEQFFGEQGLEIVVREGYQRTASWGKCHGGGRVWYQVVRKNNPNVTYRLFLARWGEDNTQIWNMEPIGKYTVIDGSTPVTMIP